MGCIICLCFLRSPEAEESTFFDTVWEFLLIFCRLGAFDLFFTRDTLITGAWRPIFLHTTCKTQALRACVMTRNMTRDMTRDTTVSGASRPCHDT